MQNTQIRLPPHSHILLVFNKRLLIMKSSEGIQEVNSHHCSTHVKRGNR